MLERARAFCERACERNGFPRLALSAGALRAIEAAEWPGNVRQLEHAVEAACIRATGERAEQVSPQHVFPSANAGARDDEGSAPPTFQEATREFQRDLIERTLEEEDWNVAATARRLDLARSYVYKCIRAFDLRRRA